MQRQLPIAEIAGTEYYIDVLREELWQKSMPGNRIPFSVFHQQKDGYTFLYNIKDHALPASKEEALAHISELIWVTLPALMELDPEGIALKYDIPLEVLCSDNTKRPATRVIASLSAVKKLTNHLK